MKRVDGQHPWIRLADPVCTRHSQWAYLVRRKDTGKVVWQLGLAGEAHNMRRQCGLVSRTEKWSARDGGTHFLRGGQGGDNR